MHAKVASILNAPARLAWGTECLVAPSSPYVEVGKGIAAQVTGAGAVITAVDPPVGSGFFGCLKLNPGTAGSWLGYARLIQLDTAGGASDGMRTWGDGNTYIIDTMFKWPANTNFVNSATTWADGDYYLECSPGIYPASGVGALGSFINMAPADTWKTDGSGPYHLVVWSMNAANVEVYKYIPKSTYEIVPGKVCRLTTVLPGDGKSQQFYIDGKKVMSLEGTGELPAPGTVTWFPGLSLWCMQAAPTGGDVTLDVDYFRVWKVDAPGGL